MVANVLSVVEEALSPNCSETRRFEIAEWLSALVYPKYKFSDFGQSHLNDERFLDFYRSYMDEGNWHSLDRKWNLSQLIKLTRNVRGDYIELGCWKGFSSHIICEEASKYPGTRVHLFDSFQGLSAPTPEIDGDWWTEGKFSISVSELHETLSKWSNYVVYEGWIPETFSRLDFQIEFRFVHVDVDLYQPTIDGLEFIFPRLSGNGVVVFDDYGFEQCKGHRLAADEFALKHDLEIVELSSAQAFFIKP